MRANVSGGAWVRRWCGWGWLLLMAASAAGWAMPETAGCGPVVLPLVAGNEIHVRGQSGDVVYVYVLPRGSGAGAAAGSGCEQREAQFPRRESQLLPVSGAQAVRLKTPLADGDRVCVTVFHGATVTAEYGQAMTVPTGAAAAGPLRVVRSEGARLTVEGPPDAVLYVYVHARDGLLREPVVCTRATLARLEKPERFLLGEQMPETVTLEMPLRDGDAVCLLATDADHPAGQMAAVALVGSSAELAGADAAEPVAATASAGTAPAATVTADAAAPVAAAQSAASASRSTATAAATDAPVVAAAAAAPVGTAPAATAAVRLKVPGGVKAGAAAGAGSANAGSAGAGSAGAGSAAAGSEAAGSAADTAGSGTPAATAAGAATAIAAKAGSTSVTAGKPAGDAAPAVPVFVQRVVAGQAKVWVKADAGVQVEVYRFAATPLPQELSSCEKNLQNGKLLEVLQPAAPNAGASANTSANAGGDTSAPESAFETVVPTGGVAAVALTDVLRANTLLCAVAIKGADRAYSSYQSVAYKPNYGRVAVSLTAGAMIDNQQQTANNGSTTGSSAAEYVNLGVNLNWARAGGGLRPTGVREMGSGKARRTVTEKKNYVWWAPGLDSFVSSSLTSLPVSAPVTTNEAGSTPAAGGAATSTLNAMSAPQSVDFSVGSALYWRATRFFNNSNFFLIGPVVEGGFDTVLNPGASAAVVTAGGSTALQTTAFSPLYSYSEAGVRIAWADLNRRTDEAPRPYTEFDFTMGEFSNLPSYVCLSGKPYGPVVATAPTTTGCAVPVAGGYRLDASRTLIPRMRVAGYMRLPQYPFVVGLDANLGQYAVGAHHNLVDMLSKPGNDVRVYFGLTIDPTTALKKLGVDTP